MDFRLVEHPKYYNVKQRTDIWFKLRWGIITGSNFPMLMPSDSQQKKIDASIKKYEKEPTEKNKQAVFNAKFNDTQKGYLLEKACETLTGLKEDFFTTQSMQWGTDTEPEACATYELEKMTIIEERGFWKLSEYIGDSPDGVTVDRCIEIKCPDSKTHLKYRINPQLLIDKYKWQCYGHMWGEDKLYCDLISYDPRFIDESKHLLVTTIKRDELEMKRLQDRLNECVDLLKEYLIA